MTNLAPIPRHWSRAHLSHVSEIPITNGVGEAAQEYVEGSVRYIRTTDIAGLHHLDDAKRVGLPREVASAALVQNGDLLMTAAGSLGTSHLVQLSEPACYAGYLVRFRANPARANARFVAWWTQSRDHLDQIAVGAVRSTIDNFSAGKFRSMSMPRPPLEEQGAIAEFLDRETAKIDALIEKQHALVSLLSERLDRVWAQTYLGLRAPEVAVRHVVESVIDGPFGSSLTSAHYADEGVRVIRLGNIGVNVFRDTDQAFVSQAYGQQLAAHGARPGDVVMAGLGDERMPLGRAAVVPEDLGPAIVKADCYRLRPGRRVSAGYLAWALSSPPVRSQIADLSRGATRSRLNTGLAKGVRIAVPSASEQARVERQWAAESTRHLALILKAEEFIGLAKERRAALITAAVTGQIEVLRKAS